MNKNFLIGYGERLVKNVSPPPKKVSKDHPYTLDEAKKRFSTQLSTLNSKILQLPSEVTPDNKMLAVLTLHPSYMAKSYFPKHLLDKFDLSAVGSRTTYIKPEKSTRKKLDGKEQQTTELFISGDKAKFISMLGGIQTNTGDNKVDDDILKVENIYLQDPIEKILVDQDSPAKFKAEIVLHTSYNQDSILQAFIKYAETAGSKVFTDKRFYVGSLCFIPAFVPKNNLEKIARFEFLRVIRNMPRLRPIGPGVQRNLKIQTTEVELPGKDPLDASIKVAVFDGGYRKGILDKWVTYYEPTGMTAPIDDDYVQHGTNVTSSILFGPNDGVHSPEVPFSLIDNYRVLDDRDTNSDDEDLYDVLHRIRNVLQNKKYDFINISIGPNIPIEDNEVNAWTAVLDDLLSDGNTLATVAIGNNGELDHDSGNARILPPADCVNVLAIGAADSMRTDWARASYSCIGSGRQNAIVKPDLLAFGGTLTEPFLVVDESEGKPILHQVQGTSFASPYVLRNAIILKANFKNEITPIGIKSLLINTREKRDLDIKEVGWGKMQDDVNRIITTEDNEARIIFQGELSPADWVRFPVPLPDGVNEGFITVNATFCYFTSTDPQDPACYTKSGIEIVFRPHVNIRKDSNQIYPDSKSFFKVSGIYPEFQKMRSDVHKWETTLSAEKKMRASTLLDPAFDIHYNAREKGNSTTNGSTIRYALVVSVRSSKDINLYNMVVNKYRNTLEVLKPQIQVSTRLKIKP